MSECFVACLLTADHYDRTSTTALYTVMLKLVKNEEGYIFKGFLHAFKLNFKQKYNHMAYIAFVRRRLFC